MTMALSTGLISGMDTGTLISQLVAAEAAPQTALKARLSSTQLAASAYRTINTTFLAVTAAAEALSSSTLTDGRKATSSATNATATASSTAVAGSSTTFTVTALASRQTLTSSTEWTSATADVRTVEPAWPIEILKGGVSVGTIDVPAGATLTEAAAAINAKGLGLKASVLQLDSDSFRLQLTSEASGSAGALVVKSATEDAVTAGSKFLVSTPAQDATLSFGGTVKATSSTNTFAELMTGVSVTVTAVGTTPVTVAVESDSDAVATKMSTLFDAINAAVNTVKDKTANGKDSKAALRGDASMTMLAGRLLDAVAEAVGVGGTPAKIGVELTRDGLVKFDKAKFVAALKTDPALAQQILVSGAAAGPGINGISGDGDDTTAVKGMAARIVDVTKAASDATTGSIVALAKGKDSLVADMQSRIDAWDLRLAKRKEMLTRQFTAMETALSSLRNQSTWLAGQISSLPTS
jgi:flagellar hook-associated protein 2